VPRPFPQVCLQTARTSPDVRQAEESSCSQRPDWCCQSFLLSSISLTGTEARKQRAESVINSPSRLGSAPSARTACLSRRSSPIGTKLSERNIRSSAVYQQTVQNARAGFECAHRVSKRSRLPRAAGMLTQAASGPSSSRCALSARRSELSPGVDQRDERFSAELNLSRRSLTNALRLCSSINR